MPKGDATYLNYLMTPIDTITKDDGIVSITHLTRAILNNFGAPNTSYQKTLKQREEGVEKPIPGPWLNSCVKKSMKKMREGKSPSGSEECTDNDGFLFGLPAFLLSLDLDIGHNIAHMISTSSVVMSNVEAQYILLAEFLKTSVSCKGIRYA